MSAAYELRRSRRRTVSLEVRADGSLLVRAPQHLGAAEIERFVAEHADWIEKAKLRQAERQKTHPQPTPEEEAILRRRAKEELPPRVEHWAKIMGLSPAAVKITSAKTRFGSCSARGNLCLSWRLMTYEQDCIDYVIVHELCHLRHMNHSADFYALVEQYLPDWWERQKKMKG